MSEFTQWSRWFECGLELKRHKTHGLAMMAWIAAHAASDGSGIEFTPEVWESIGEEIGVSVEESKVAVDALIGEGLVAQVGPTAGDRLVARAVV